MIRRAMSIATIARSLLVVGALSVAFRPAPAGAATPQQVDDAIKKAAEYLRKQQRPDGSWEGGPDALPNHFGGYTAIATYGLLAGGASPQDEHIQRAVKWLGNADIKGIYELGLRAQVWTYLEPNAQVRAAAKRDADLLLKSADANGRWGYTTSRGGEHNSTTQYGVLGLWAAARMGFEVPAKFWKASEQGWYACQDPKGGGWAYRSAVPIPDAEPGYRVRPSMTAAGLASLFIAQDYLRANDGIRCTGNITNDRIELGLKWMGDHYDPKWSDLYLLYGIERVGVASGYKYFGKHDWYALGADVIVRNQQPDGSWRYGTEGKHRVPGTAFAIFFLTRGRAPVVMNKLRYEFEPLPDKKESVKDAARWNQRPRDVANVVRWMGESMERDLNWQIVNLRANAEDLLDAPLLYLSGDQALRLSDEDKRTLKSYVDQGGIILGQADCGKKPFVASFRELGNELFPRHEFRVLPAGHFVYNEQYPAAKWKDKVAVEGLSNGVRELMLLIPSEDVARSWQQRATEQKTAHFQLASNIFLYAVDKANLRTKGETYVIKPDPKAKARRTIKLARIRYGGNWDPEPGGWRRFGAHLLNTYGLGLTVEVVRLGSDAPPAAAAAVAPQTNADKARASRESRGAAGAKAEPAGAGNTAPDAAEASLPTSLKNYDVAHLTGTTAFQLTPEARDELRRFVEGGGTLIVDAAGGASAFAQAADQELFKIFKDDHKQLAQPLKTSHGAYNLPASKVTTVGYRTFAREKLGNLRAPRVRGIDVKDRTKVFVSAEDLSAGLVGQHVDGIYGYDPRSALQLVTNLVLYATNEGNKPPSTQPSTKPSTQPARKASGPAKP